MSKTYKKIMHTINKSNILRSSLRHWTCFSIAWFSILYRLALFIRYIKYVHTFIFFISYVKCFSKWVSPLLKQNLKLLTKKNIIKSNQLEAHNLLLKTYTFKIDSSFVAILDKEQPYNDKSHNALTAFKIMKHIRNTFLPLLLIYYTKYCSRLGNRQSRN